MGAFEVQGPFCLAPAPCSVGHYLHACPFDGQAFGPLQHFLPPFPASKAEEEDLPSICLEIPVGPDVAVGHHILPLFPDLEAVVPVQGRPFFQRLWWWWSWWLPFWQPLPLWLGWGAPQPWRLWWCGWLCQAAAAGAGAQADILLLAIQLSLLFWLVLPFLQGPTLHHHLQVACWLFLLLSCFFFSCCFFLFDFFSSQLCSGSGSASLAEAAAICSCLAALLLCAVLLCAVLLCALSSCLFSKGWAAFFSSLSTSIALSFFSLLLHLLFHLSCSHVLFLLLFLMLLPFFQRLVLLLLPFFQWLFVLLICFFWPFFQRLWEFCWLTFSQFFLVLCLFLQGLLGLPSQLPCPAGGSFPLESPFGVVGVPPFPILLLFFLVPLVSGHALFSRAPSLAFLPKATLVPRGSDPCFPQAMLGKKGEKKGEKKLELEKAAVNTYSFQPGPLNTWTWNPMENIFTPPSLYFQNNNPPKYVVIYGRVGYNYIEGFPAQPFPSSCTFFHLKK